MLRSPAQSLDLTIWSGGARYALKAFNKLLSSKAQDFLGPTDFLDEKKTFSTEDNAI